MSEPRQKDAWTRTRETLGRLTCETLIFAAILGLHAGAEVAAVCVVALRHLWKVMRGRQ